MWEFVKQKFSVLYHNWRETVEREVYSLTGDGASLREAVELIWALNDVKGFYRWRRSRWKAFLPQVSLSSYAASSEGRLGGSCPLSHTVYLEAHGFPWGATLLSCSTLLPWPGLLFVCALHFQLCWMEQACQASFRTGETVFVFFKCMIFKEVNFIKIVMFLQKVLLSQTFGNTLILWNSWILEPGVTI